VEEGLQDQGRGGEGLPTFPGTTLPCLSMLLHRYLVR